MYQRKNLIADLERTIVMNKKNFMDYERPSVTADVVLFQMGENYVNNRKSAQKQLRVLLMKRETQPHNGKFSLPGGFVGIDETIEDVAKKKVLEKTGFDNFYMEQLYTFDGLNRDERWRVISTTYIGIAKPSTNRKQDGTHISEWFNIVNDNKLVGVDTGIELTFDDLAFDHGNIIKVALERVRGKLFYTNIGFEFEENEFTVGGLNETFNAVMQKRIVNFKRTMNSRIEPTGKTISGRAHRPAELYRKKN